MKAGWKTTTVKNIAVVDWGNTDLTKKAYVTDGPFLGVSAAGCDGRMAHAEHKKFTPVLSAIGAQCGRMFMPDEDFTAIKNTITLTPIGDTCDPFFLFYLFTMIQLPQRGAGQPFISKGDIEKFVVSIPYLEEQQQIVAVLDEAFVGLAHARAHAEANLRDARELFATVLDELLGQEKPTWSGKSIAEVCSIGDGNHSSKYPKNSEMVTEGVPFIRSSNIQNGRVDQHEMLFISAEKHQELKKGHLKTDDILFTNRGEIGKVAIVPPELDGSNLNSQVAWLRCRESLSHKFLYFFLQSRNLRKHYLDTQSGAALQQFTIRMLKDVQVSFPALDEQEDLVERVVEIHQATETLKAAYVLQVSEIDALRQSLLQKAFAGELT